MSERSSSGSDHRAAITICVILAALLQALDSTIANVALPFVQGSMAASQDQMGWVLTSYLVAAGIMTPATGFLTERFGLKNVLLFAVAGFTASSMLCGAAQSLPQIVAFRLLQGVFGAPLIPLSQTVLMNIYPKERQGSAMALWSVAVMAGPAVGPALGGWLTSAYNWRYVFYVNVPVGAAAFAGLWLFLKGPAHNVRPKLDWLGFGALSLAIAAFQLLLDRGEQLDWFASKEILIEALIAGSAFYIFVAHIATARAPFLRPSLLRDRNFTAGTIFGTILGLTFYASLALQPPYLQNMMGYPILTTGIVLAPFGFSQMAASMLVGRLIGKVDTRVLLALGLGCIAWSFYLRLGWTPDVSAGAIVASGVIQGVGLGTIFVPLSITALSSLSADVRAEGAGFFTLTRNLGSGVGIAVVNALLVHNIQANHADISHYVTATNLAFSDPSVARLLNPFTAAGRAALDATVTHQAQVIAYMDDYKLLMIATLAMFPLLLVFRPPAADAASDHAMVLE